MKEQIQVLLYTRRLLKVLEGETPEILQKRVMEQAEWKILPQAINDIANGKIAIGEIILLNRIH